MYVCNQQEETLLSAERGQPLGENQLESAGGGIYSPAGHYFADDNDHVRQFLNDSVITSTDTVVAVSQISFFDTTNYSYAIVAGIMSDSQVREFLTVFRFTSYVSLVPIDSISTIQINDNTPRETDPPTGGGINYSMELTVNSCLSTSICENFYGQDCRFYRLQRRCLHCGCPATMSPSSLITVGEGCGLDHNGDGLPK